MKFVEIETSARSLDPERVDSTLRELMRDPRFGAVVRLLYEYREHLVNGASSPLIASNGGAGSIMAHYLGGVDATLALEARLRGICETPQES